MKCNPNDSAYPSDLGKCNGLTKRELFAAMAMQGICANPGVIWGEHKLPEHPGDCRGSIAKAAVRIADALIAALNETTQN